MREEFIMNILEMPLRSWQKILIHTFKFYYFDVPSDDVINTKW